MKIASLRSQQGLPRGAHPESYEILPLHGVYPERDPSVAEPVLSGEILRFAQNDKESEGLPQNDKKRRAQGDNRGSSW